MIDLLMSILKRRGTDYDTVVLISQAANILAVYGGHKHRDIQDKNGEFEQC